MGRSYECCALTICAGLWQLLVNYKLIQMFIILTRVTICVSLSFFSQRSIDGSAAARGENGLGPGTATTQRFCSIKGNYGSD
jgi:hypothetical protein